MSLQDLLDKNIKSFSDRKTNNIDIFPTTVQFQPQYPRKTGNFTLTISNPSTINKKVGISLNGDTEFSVPNSIIDVEAGSIYSLVLIFHPKKIGTYKTTLKLESVDNTPCFVVIEGKCIKSPLKIHEDLIRQFKFSKINNICTFTVFNRSTKTNLHVYLSSNSKNFSVDLQNLEIEPVSSQDCQITFNGDHNIEEYPELNVQCTETGDSYSIPLTIAEMKNIVTVDFGNFCIGKQKSLKVHLDNTKLKNQPKHPFSIANIGYRDIDFIFANDKIGEYEQMLEFENFYLTLKGKTCKPFYSVKIKEDNAMIMTNETDEMQVCIISYSKDFENSSMVTFMENEKKEIFINQENLYLSYTEGTETIYDEFHFDLDKIDDEEDIENENDTISNEEILNLSPQKTKKSRKLFIDFFQITKEKPNIAAKKLDSKIVSRPNWITYEKKSNNYQFYVEQLPQPCIIDKMICKDSFEVPIIAYEEFSDIEIVVDGKLERMKDGKFYATAEVINHGLRQGFCFFVCKNQKNVYASPSALVIEGGRKKTVQFIVNDEIDKDVEIKFYAGDEILRQICSYYDPKSKYNNLFEGVDYRDEITSMHEKLDEINITQFMNIFKKYVQIEYFKLQIDNKF